MNTQRPSSAYYPPTVGSNQRPTNLHQSIPNLKSPPSVHRLHQEDSRSGSFPSVNSRADDRPPQYPPNYQQEIKHQQYPSSPHVVSPQYQQNYQGYSPHMPNNQRGHEELMRQQSNDIRYQQNLMREDAFRQSQQGRIEEIRMNNGDLKMRNEEMMRYPSSNNIKTNDGEMIRNSEIVRTGDVIRPSKSEDMIRQQSREEMMRYNSTNNIRAQEEIKMEDRQYAQKQTDDIRQSNITRPDEIVRQNAKNPEEIVRQHPINASLRGQAKMAEMSEEVRRRQNRAGYNQYPPNATQYPYQSPNNANYYQQNYQTQYYNQSPQYNQQQYQQPMSPSYVQSSNAYNHQTPTSTNPRTYNSNQMAQAQNAMQNLNLNTYQTNVTSPNFNNQNNYNYSGPISPQSFSKLPPTAPKPAKKIDDVPPELPPSSTHPLYAASLQEGPPKGAFYPSNIVQGKPGPANPWEREEREKVISRLFSKWMVV